MKLFAGPPKEDEQRVFVHVYKAHTGELRIRVEDDQTIQDIAALKLDVDGKLFLQFMTLSEERAERLNIANRCTGSKFVIVYDSTPA